MRFSRLKFWFQTFFGGPRWCRFDGEGERGTRFRFLIPWIPGVPVRGPLWPEPKTPLQWAIALSCE